MTALNFILDPKYVIITTDTLISRSEDKQPSNYASKIFPLPHIKGVLCGTGVFEIIFEWFYVIQ